MLGSYFKITWRIIQRHKLFTLINVAGLALSMCIGMLMIAMIMNLAEFDRFHANKDRVFRVTSKVFDPARSDDYKATATKIICFTK